MLKQQQTQPPPPEKKRLNAWVAPITNGNGLCLVGGIFRSFGKIEQERYHMRVNAVRNAVKAGKSIINTHFFYFKTYAHTGLYAGKGLPVGIVFKLLYIVNAATQKNKVVVFQFQSGVWVNTYGVAFDEGISFTVKGNIKVQLGKQG